MPVVLLLEPDVPSNLPAVVFLGLWFGALAGFAGIMGAIFSRWHLVRFDRSLDRLELRGSGRFIWLPRQVSVPLDRVRGLRLLLGPEELDPLPFIWEIAYEPRGGRARKAHVTVTVQAIDRREEALDLTFRVAELLGWEAVQLERHDPLVVEIRLARSGAELDDPRPIPRLETWLGYQADPAGDEEAPRPDRDPPPE